MTEERNRLSGIVHEDSVIYDSSWNKTRQVSKKKWKTFEKTRQTKNKADCFTREIGTNSLYRNVFSY